MRIHLLALVVFASTTIAARSQVSSTTLSPAQDRKPTSTLLTLNGCVQNNAGTNQFTVWDPNGSRKERPVYRLSGVDLNLFAGRRVRIVGGLVPSVNVAAQAGALDPAQSSLVRAGGVNAGGNVAPMVGTTPLPEFHVKSIKPLAGSCAPQ